MTSDKMKIAQSALDKAMSDYLTIAREEDFGVIPADSMPIGWMAIVEAVKYDEDEHSLTSIGLIYEGGDMRLVSAIGMCTMGLDIMRSALVGPHEH